MIIEIKGAGFDNYGARLMLTSVLQRLEVFAPDARIALSSRGGVCSLRRNELNALRKIDVRVRWLDLNGATRFIPAFFRRFLRGRGVVFECDLDAIMDIAGFGYSDQWGSDYAIRHAVAEAKRFAESERHYIFMPQAFGPFSAQSTRDLIRRKLPYASLVAARDQISYATIRDITGEFDRLMILRDFTNGIGVAGVISHQVPKPYMVVVPNANMLSAHSTRQGWSATYVDVLSTAIAEANELGLATVLINFGGPMDQALIGKLHNLWPAAELASVTSDLEAKALVSGATVAISSRYHACICALSAGVPCLGTSWSHKYEALYDDYGVQDLLLAPDVAPVEVRRLVRNSMEPSAAIRPQLERQASEFRASTESLWRLVEDILKK